MANPLFTLSRPQPGVRLQQLLKQQVDRATNFSPESIAGLKLWMETGDYFTINPLETGGTACEDNEVCLEWPDASSNNKDFTVAVNGPTYQKPSGSDSGTPNGKGRLVFNGTTSILQAAAAADW